MKKILLAAALSFLLITLLSCSTPAVQPSSPASENETYHGFTEITDPNKITQIVLSEQSVRLAVGESFIIEYSVLPETADASDVFFSSDSDSVTVNEEGLVTAVADTPATVTVSSPEGISASLSVETYIIPAETFEIKDDMIIGIGESVEIKTRISPEDTSIRRMDWTSSDESIFTVSDDGFVTGVAKGNATLTGTTTDGSDITDSVKITVTRGPYSPLSEIPPARYINDGGKYINPGSSGTGHAVMMFSGDNMALSAQQGAARTNGTFDFNESFDFVRKLFSSADFACGNLESVISHSYAYTYEQKEANGNPLCNAPATFLDALRYAGYDAVVTANNHCSDAGRQGVIETNRMLDKYLLAHTGTFSDRDDQRFMIFDINGINVGILSYTELINSGWGYSGDDERSSMLNRWSEDRMKADIAAAKEAGAEFIVIYTHWGAEFQQKSNSEQKKHAQIMADAGAGLIIGSHSHCLQEASVLTAEDGRSVPCIYSMSNFVSSMGQTMCNDTIILKVTLDRTGSEVSLSDWGYIGCRVFPDFDGRKYAIVPVIPELNGGYEKASLNEARQRISAVLGDAIREITSTAE